MSPRARARRARGLEYAFLISLVTLGAAGGLLVWGRRSYPRDVATAAASIQATASTGTASSGSGA